MPDRCLLKNRVFVDCSSNAVLFAVYTVQGSSNFFEAGNSKVVMNTY